MEVYVDSNVFISIIKEDFGRNFEFMDLKSIEFVERALNCKYNLVVSDLVIEEFCKITGLTESDFNDLFEKNPKKIRVVEVKQEDVNNAKKLKGKFVNGLKDSIHASIALREKCGIICTWNVDDFIDLEDKYSIEILKPNQL